MDRRSPSGGRPADVRVHIGRRLRARAGPQLLLHRAQLPPAGRASRERARDRDRHRARAAAHRRGRAGRADGASSAQRTRDRAADQRRGPVPRFSARAGDDRALPPAARADRPRRHVRRGRDGGLAVLRLADRQADRVGREPAGCDLRALRALGELEVRGVRRRARPRSTSCAAGVPAGRLLDDVPRRGRRAPPGAEQVGR